MYSIFIPLLSRSKTIQRCLNAIHNNSIHKHEIILTVDETDVYYAFNEGVYKCKYDTVVLLNDDMIVSRGWDALIPTYAAPDKIITGCVVERKPGRLMYGPSCIEYDCGDENNFDQDKFEKFAVEYGKDMPDYLPNASGWYMPLIVNKKTFVTYPNIGKFPYCANDMLLFEMLSKIDNGYKFGVIKSCFYHFSHTSSRT